MCGAVHPIRDLPPAQVGTLAMVMEKRTFSLATDGDHGVGVEAAVGPHRELPLGPGMAQPHGLPRENRWRPRSRDISTSQVPAATASSG